MQHGHITGTKRERRPRQQTTARYARMGAAISATLASQTLAELLRQVNAREPDHLATPRPAAPRPLDCALCAGLGAARTGLVRAHAALDLQPPSAAPGSWPDSTGDTPRKGDLWPRRSPPAASSF